MAKIVLTISADNKATQSVRLLNAEVQTLSKTLSSVKVNKDLTAQIKALTANYKEMGKVARETLKLETQQITNQARQQRLMRQTASQVKMLEKRYADLLSAIKAVESKYPKGTFDQLKTQTQANLKAVQGLKEGTEGYADEVKRLTAEQQNLATQFSVTKAETEKVTTAVVKSGDSIGSLAKKFLLWQVTATLVMKPLRLISDALSSINETLVKTEDAVISLQRVLPSGSASDSEISSRLYKIAQDYGQTFENVQQIATNFARTGMSWADTIKATEAAVLALNVAELDAEEATTGLVAILSQFGKDAGELEEVIDKLNKTADNFPVTTEKILAALQRTGSAADNANLSLDQTIALITALSKATGRSGQNIGTALNSLIQYSSKSTALDTFAKLSDDTEKVVTKFRQGGATILDVWEAVSKEIQNLKSEQADLLDGYFSTEDGQALSEALDGELEDIYTELGGVYDTANTFRKNYFIALLGNMDTVEQAMGTLDKASGYSQKENQKYLDTYTAKLNSLQAKWQEIANDEQGWLGFKKGLVDLGSGVLTLIGYMGGLKAVIIPIVTLFGVMFAGSIMSGLTKFTHGIKNLGESFKHPIKSLKELKIATTNYNAALKAQSVAMQEQKIALEAQNKATELQTFADQKAAIAQQLKTQNEQAATVTTEMATAAEQAQTLADEAQTLATQQQTIATELNTKAEQKAALAGKQLTAASREMGAAASSAAGIWGILAFVIFEVINAIDAGIASIGEANREEIEKNKETVNSFIEVTDAVNKEIAAIKDYSNTIKNIENILSDESSSALQLETANNQLLTIQNELIASNKEYADSIDLVNGKLNEQSEIVKTKSEEEAQKLAQEYLSRNAGAVAAAQKIIDGTSSKIQVGTGNIDAKFGELGIIKEVASKLGLDNVDTSVLRLGGEGWIPFGGLVNEAADAIAGEKEFSVWNGLIERGVKQLFTKEGWAGRATANINLSGSVAEQLETIKQIRNYLSEHKSEYDEQDVKDIQAALEAQYQTLNSSDYQNALKTIEANEMYQKYADGSISLGQLQSWLAGDKEWSTQWINSLEHLSSTAKENLINAMEEARDLQKEALELSEKQLAVEEARVALQNAQNQATVRRFNEATGRWEWQVDEKKVAEAQEKLNEAQKNLTEYTEEKAWNETKSAIEKGNATNQSILEIIAKWAQASMSNDDTFGSDIYNILKSNGIDLKEKEFKVNGDGTQEVVSYDSGGIANGFGFMPKATEKSEGVLNPDLTAKILSPVSNAEFNRYVKDMGIMFEQAHNYARIPQFERVNNTSTDNSVNNSGQINFAGGLTVGSEQRDNMLNILSLAKIVPN